MAELHLQRVPAGVEGRGKEMAVHSQTQNKKDEKQLGERTEDGVQDLRIGLERKVSAGPESQFDKRQL